jgi:hypothetical protein
MQNQGGGQQGWVRAFPLLAATGWAFSASGPPGLPASILTRIFHF